MSTNEVEGLSILKELIGSQLSSVEFVQDYLQLRFDGPTINVNNPLTIKTKESEITSWDEGFRDLLCGQITKIVVDVGVESEKELRIIFMDNSQVSISLHPEDFTSPEAIYAHGFSDNKWITY